MNGMMRYTLIVLMHLSFFGCAHQTVSLQDIQALSSQYQTQLTHQDHTRQDQTKSAAEFKWAWGDGSSTAGRSTVGRRDQDNAERLEAAQHSLNHDSSDNDSAFIQSFSQWQMTHGLQQLNVCVCLSAYEANADALMLGWHHVQLLRAMAPQYGYVLEVAVRVDPEGPIIIVNNGVANGE